MDEIVMKENLPNEQTGSCDIYLFIEMSSLKKVVMLSRRCGSCVATCISGKVWMANNEVLMDDEIEKGRIDMPGFHDWWGCGYRDLKGQL